MPVHMVVAGVLLAGPFGGGGAFQMTPSAFHHR